MRKLIAVLVIFAIAAYFQLTSYKEWQGQIFKFDASGYYLYLPATFIYEDVDDLSFYPYLDSVYHPSGAGTWYSIYPQAATGKKLNKYPVGTAIGELPFFLIAHAYVLSEGSHKADGYSLPYQLAICIGTLVWALVGLYLLGRFLIAMWGTTVGLIALMVIGFGTNLYCYSVTGFGMSHVFQFMLISMLLYCTWQWHANLKPKYIYFLAALLGLILITRPTDIPVVLIPLVWGVNNKESFYQKWQNIRNSRWHFALGFLLFVCICSVQIGYWKWVTGKFFYYSYEGESFNFLAPNIIKGLFSYRNGWFVYTPLALLGFLGLIPLYKTHKSLAVWIGIYFAIVIYIVYSWWAWRYGWSFGARAMINSLPVLSIGIAALVAVIVKQRVWIRVMGGLIVAFFIWMNIYQTNQYIMQALPGEGITKEYYWRMWNRMHSEDEDRKYLKYD